MYHIIVNCFLIIIIFNTLYMTNKIYRKVVYMKYNVKEVLTKLDLLEIDDEACSSKVEIFGIINE